jgi:Ca2+-binding RTX toxin-like protein
MTIQSIINQDQFADVIFSGRLNAKEIFRYEDVKSKDGNFLGDWVGYELKDKLFHTRSIVYVFEIKEILPNPSLSPGKAEVVSGATPDIGDITEIYWMSADHGKLKPGQLGDPDLTFMSLKNLDIDSDEFLAGYSDDDSFNRYPYVVSLFDGAAKIKGNDSGNSYLEVGQGGKAVVDGEGGNDVLHVWHQKTVDFDGGKGSDTLDFGQNFGRIDDLPETGATVDLRNGTGANPWGGTIKLTSVENVMGFYGAANVLTGDDGANRITSGGYGDALKGMGGNDTITVWASFVTEADGPRNLHADGGKGIDTLVFQSIFEAPNTLDLEHPEDNTGTFAGSTFKNFEIFRGDGLMGMFTFHGSDADEKVLPNLSSSAGDVLDGRGGDDVLNGGGGADTLTGGTGADAFQFTLTFDSAPDAPDTITDFSHAEHDKIDLKKLSFDKLDFIGDGEFDGKAGELRATQQGSQTLVEVDTDGDKAANFALLLDNHPKLSESDFAL